MASALKGGQLCLVCLDVHVHHVNSITCIEYTACVHVNMIESINQISTKHQPKSPVNPEQHPTGLACMNQLVFIVHEFVAIWKRLLVIRVSHLF